MIKNTTKRQKLGWVIFIVYLIFLAYFLFFSEDFGRGSHLQEEYAYNLVPFKEIRRFIVYWHVVGIRSFLLNIVGNVVGFMPFGFFLPVISRRSRHWYNTCLLYTSIEENRDIKIKRDSPFGNRCRYETADGSLRGGCPHFLF